MKEVVLTQRAQQDLFEQIDWLFERSPKAAMRAEQAIRSSMTIVAEFPEIAEVSVRGHRDCIVRFGKYGFVLRYRRFGDQILVTRVFHGTQNRSR